MWFHVVTCTCIQHHPYPTNIGAGPAAPHTRKQVTA